MAEFMGWLTSQQPEYNQTKIKDTLCNGNGRDVIRVQSKGTVTIQYEIDTMHMNKLK